MPRFMPEHRLYANDLAGGGILDVGCYPVSMRGFVAGAALGKPFANPVKVLGTAQLGESGVDEWSAATLHFDGGILAEVSCAVSLSLDNVLRIFGTKGRIEIADFWFAGGNRDRGPGTDRRHPRRQARDRSSSTRRGTSIRSRRTASADALAAGRQEFASPGMSWDDTLGNLRTLDQWRAGAGLTYGIETPARRTTTVANRTLAARGPQIPKAQINGVAIPTSKVALGFEFFPSFAAASITLDGFYERGGNLFDTGYVYMAGKTEQQLGDWHTSRGVKRGDFAVIGKGAHSPLHYPDVIAKQLNADAGAAEDRLCRHLFHAPRQSRHSGRRVRRCGRCRGESRPYPRGVGRLELDARAHGRGDQVRQAQGQAGADRAQQQLLARRRCSIRSGRVA